MTKIRSEEDAPIAPALVSDRTTPITEEEMLNMLQRTPAVVSSGRLTGAALNEFHHPPPRPHLPPMTDGAMRLFIRSIPRFDFTTATFEPSPPLPEQVMFGGCRTPVQHIVFQVPSRPPSVIPMLDLDDTEEVK